MGQVQPGLASVVASLIGDDPPVAVEFYDGSRLGPPDPTATVVVRRPEALARIVTAPGELGFARAYVSGDVEIDGDIYAVIGLRDRLPRPRLTPRQWVEAVRVLGLSELRPLAPPPEEARLRGRRHSSGRDAAAVSHHYDVGNEFYELVLGDAMTYSCAVWADPPPPDRPSAGLADAQWAKHELVCQKLGLRPGMRLLDVGCGWGAMVRHAARHHGVEAIGITISAEQAAWARRRVAEDDLTGRVEIRLQDYRNVHDGPFDAISSIGMFEHVGLARLGEYFQQLERLVVPGGRVLNHAISRPPGARPGFARRSFVNRYVFPDGELHEVGSVVTAMQAAGLEARHLENLREHYALTLRAWVANLESDWDRAVGLVGANRARIWRLYMAGSAVGFEDGRIGVNQVLGVRPDAGRSRFPLREDWDRSPAPEAMLLTGQGRPEGHAVPT
jgi:cyclopropane-fatty-acyl-phospholipid synthase